MKMSQRVLLLLATAAAAYASQPPSDVWNATAAPFTITPATSMPPYVESHPPASPGPPFVETAFPFSPIPFTDSLFPPTPTPFIIGSGDEHRIVVATREHAPGPDGVVSVSFAKGAALDLQNLTATDVHVILRVSPHTTEEPFISVGYLNLRNATVEVRYVDVEVPECNIGGLRVKIAAALFDDVSLVGLRLRVDVGAVLSLRARQTVLVGHKVCDGLPPIQSEGQVTIYPGVRLRPHPDAWPGRAMLPVLLKVDGYGALAFVGPGTPPHVSWRGAEAHGLLRPVDLLSNADSGASDMCEWWRRRGSASRTATGGDAVVSVQDGEVRLDGQVSATLTQGAEVLLDALTVHGNTSEAVVVVRDGSSLSVARTTTSSTWFETKGGALVFGALATETGQTTTFQHDVVIIEALAPADVASHPFPGPYNPSDAGPGSGSGSDSSGDNAVAFCHAVDVADGDVRVEAVRLADLDYLSPSSRLFLTEIPMELRTGRIARVVFGGAADVSVANGVFRIGPSYRTELLRGSLRLRQAKGWFKGPVWWALDGFHLASEDDGESAKELLLDGPVFMVGRSILTPQPVPAPTSKADADAIPSFAPVEPDLAAWSTEAEVAAAHGVSVVFRGGTPQSGAKHIVVGSLESFGSGGGGSSGESDSSDDGRSIPYGSVGYAVFPYRVVADGVEVKVVGSVAFTGGGLWTTGMWAGSALCPDEPPPGHSVGGGGGGGGPPLPTDQHPDPERPPADSPFFPPFKTGSRGGGSRRARSGVVAQEEGNETQSLPTHTPPYPQARVYLGGMHRATCDGVGGEQWCQLAGPGLAGSVFEEVGIMSGSYLRLGTGVEVWTHTCEVSRDAVLHAEGCGTAADLGGSFHVAPGGTLAINQSGMVFGASGGFTVGDLQLEGRYVAFLHHDGVGDGGRDQCSMPLFAESIDAPHTAEMACGAPVALQHATVHIALLAETHGVRDIPREHRLRHPVNCTPPGAEHVAEVTLVTNGDGLYYLRLSVERGWLWALLGTGFLAPLLTWVALAAAFRLGGGGGALSFAESLRAQPPIHVRLTFEEARYFLPNFVVGAFIVTESFFLATVAFHPALRWPHASQDTQRRLSDVVHLGGLEGGAFQGLFATVVVCVGAWGLLWSPLLPRPCVRGRAGGSTDADVESPAGTGSPSQAGAASAAKRFWYCCGRSPRKTHVFLFVHRLLCALGNFFFIPLQLVLLGTFDCPYSPDAGDYVSRFDGELCSDARDVRATGVIASIVLSVAVFHSGSNATSPFGHPPFRSDLDIRHKRTFEACRVALLQLQVLLLCVLSHEPTALAASSLGVQSAYLAVTCLCYPCGYYNVNRARGLLQSFGPVGLAVALWKAARGEPAGDCANEGAVLYVVLAVLCVACVAVYAFVARHPPGGGDGLVVGGGGGVGGGSVSGRDIGGIGDGRSGASRTALENDECVARLLRVTSTQRQKLRVLRGTIGEMTSREWRGGGGSTLPSAGSSDSDEAAAVRARNAGDMKLQYRKELESYRRFKEAYLVPFYLGLDMESSLTDTWSSSDQGASGNGKEGGDVLALSGSGRDAFDNSAYEGWVRGQLLGRGSFGSVFTGVLRCGALVAVKVVDLHLDEGVKEELGNVQKEVDFLRKLRHPNVIEYKACFVDHEACSIYIFMEYAVGGSLTSLVKKCHEPLSEDVVRGYIAQVITGLAFLHSHNVIHRDVKGENVLLDAAGKAKLADFGCARDVSAATKNVGTCVGSPYWMAPEVIKNSGYDSKADVWSVGCTTVEALNKGKPPWKEFDSVFAAMYHVTHTDEAPNNKPAGLSPAADQFLDACFNRDPADRPTAKELLQCTWFDTSKAADPDAASSGRGSPLAGSMRGLDSVKFDAAQPDGTLLSAPPADKPETEDTLFSAPPTAPNDKGLAPCEVTLFSEPPPSCSPADVTLLLDAPTEPFVDDASASADETTAISNVSPPQASLHSNSPPAHGGNAWKNPLSRLDRSEGELDDVPPPSAPPLDDAI